MSVQLALSLGAIALLFPFVKRRLELSFAKHPSLTGHSRMAKRVVGLLPGYEFKEDQFFSCDGAPESVAANRRSAFYKLANLLQTRHAKIIQMTAEWRETNSDVKVKGAHTSQTDI